MRPKKLSYTFAAINATGYISNGGVSPWVLTGTTPGDGCGHLVTIHNDSATDYTLTHATITGTDAEGRAQTETIHLPNVHAGGSDAVASTKYFKTVTSITHDATIIAQTFDAGWGEVAVTPAYPTAVYPHDGPMVMVNIGGTINYTLQETNDQIFTNSPAAWATVGAAGKTANFSANGSIGCTAVRVLVNSHTSGTADFMISQARR